MYLRVNVFSISSFLIVVCIGWYSAQNLCCNWNLNLTKLRHTLHCNPGSLHTEEISKIHQNPFALKINISSPVFTFFLHFNSLNTRSTSTSSLFDIFIVVIPDGNYILKVNRKIRTRCEICSKLTIKIPERRGVILVSLLLTLNIFHTLF